MRQPAAARNERPPHAGAWRLLPPAAAAVLVTTYWLLPQAAAPVAYLVVAGCSVAALFRWGRWRRAPGLRWWSLLAAGVVLWLAADAAWYLVDVADRWWTDALYLPAYLLFAGGLWRLSRAATVARSRFVLLDALIGGAAGGFLVWYLLILPALEAGRATEVLVAGLYPLLDLVLLALLLRILVFGPVANRSVQLLVGAFGALLIGNYGYALVVQTSAYPVGALLDVAWLAFYVLLAAAAIHPSSSDVRASGEETERLTPLRGALVGSAMLVVPAYWLAVQWLDLPEPWLGGAISSLVIAVLVMARLLMSLDDQARAHRRLRASEERFSKMVEHSFDAVTVHDRSGAIVFASPSASTVFGRTPDELRGQRLLPLVHPDDVAGVRESLWAARPGGGPATVGARVLDATGRYRELEVRIHALTDGPVAGGHLVTTRDVTEQRAAEAALRSSEARFRAVFEHAGVGIALDDADGYVVAANAAFEELVGRTDVVGRHFVEWSHPDDLASDVALLEDVIAGERDSYRIEKRFVRPDGEERWARLTVTPAQPGGDGDLYAIAMTEDITVGRLAAERLGVQGQMLDAVGEAIIATDLEGRVTYWNPAAERLFGWSAAEALGRSIIELNVSAIERGRAEEIFDAVSAGETWTGQFPVQRKDGTVFTALVTDSPFIGPDGQLAGIIGVSTDVTEQERTAQRLQWRADQQAALARLGQRALKMRSVRALQRAATETVRDLLGASECAFAATTDEPVDDVTPGAGGALAVCVAAREVVFGVLRAKPAPGDDFDADDLSFLQAVANVLAAGIEHDEGQRQLEHQSLHDPLTNLPNRTLLHDRVGHALRRAQRGGGRVAVLFADLDRFKLVNDGLGHGIGDRVLTAAAQRMQGAIRPGDTIARLGGDEFAVICDPVQDEAAALAIARRLLDALATPIVLDGHELFVSASIGVAVGGDGATAEGLLRDADIAMYRAKDRGRNRCELFDHGLQQAAFARLELDNALRYAVDRGELELHYQPEVDIATGRVIAAEALMRWNHPTRGLVSPAEFIPIAEDTGAITALGEWALRTACATAAGWAAAGGPPPAVSVNLSPKQLGQPNLCETVISALRDSGLDAGRLWLEVTEGAVMHDPEAAIATLERLKGLGVLIAIDDFGTGYSSLAHLKAFPLGALKIDRSFVSGLGDDIQDRSIVAATIELARALDLLSIAEGVQTEQQLDDLRGLGCDLGQGYYWSRPVDSARLQELISPSVKRLHVPRMPRARRAVTAVAGLR